MKILLYCPLAPETPKIYTRTLKSIFALEWSGPVDIMFGRDDHGARNREAAYDEITAKYEGARQTALAGEYDAMFTVESDMILPENALARLAQVDADVAYGLYVSRHGRHQWLAYPYMDERSGTPMSADAINARSAWGQAVETQGVGMGCTLIHRHVLETVPFRREPGKLANDWYFSLDLKAAGYRQVHDCGVVCGHIAWTPSPRIYWPDPDEHLLYREEFLTPPEPAQTQTLIIDRIGSHKLYTMAVQQ